MRDKTYEARILELETNVENLKTENTNLKSENSKLKEHAVLLANELRDREQQIATYEKQFYRKPHE